MNQLVTEARALCEGATKGPWTLMKEGRYEDHDECRIELPDDNIELCRYENGELVARSRTLIPEMAAEIERLQAELDALKANAPEWIDVNDRLPERPDFDWVLVRAQFVPEGWCGVPHIAELRWGKWYVSDFDTPYEETVHAKITHWMPIPDPPIKALAAMKEDAQ